MVNNLLYFSFSRVQIAGFCTRRVIDGGISCSFAPVTQYIGCHGGESGLLAPVMKNL